MNIDASFCGLDEVDISNPTYEGTWAYENNNGNLEELYKKLDSLVN